MTNKPGNTETISGQHTAAIQGPLLSLWPPPTFVGCGAVHINKRFRIVCVERKVNYRYKADTTFLIARPPELEAVNMRHKKSWLFN